MLQYYIQTNCSINIREIKQQCNILTREQLDKNPTTISLHIYMSIIIQKNDFVAHFKDGLLPRGLARLIGRVEKLGGLAESQKLGEGDLTIAAFVHLLTEKKRRKKKMGKK